MIQAWLFSFVPPRSLWQLGAGTVPTHGGSHASCVMLPHSHDRTKCSGLWTNKLSTVHFLFSSVQRIALFWWCKHLGFIFGLIQVQYTLKKSFHSEQVHIAWCQLAQTYLSELNRYECVERNFKQQKNNTSNKECNVHYFWVFRNISQFEHSEKYFYYDPGRFQVLPGYLVDIYRMHSSNLPAR